MSSIIPSLAKLGVCAGVAFGITYSPVIFKSPETILGGNEVKSAPPKPKRVRTVKLGDTQKGDGFSLSNSDNVNKLLKGEKDRLSVDEAGIKFEGITLSKNDILYSPCQNGTYYLIQGGNRLTNGTRFVVGYCPSGKIQAPYTGINHIKLTWSKPNWHDMPLTTINLSDCSFSKEGEESLKITCNKGKGLGQEIQGVFDKGDYTYEE